MKDYRSKSRTFEKAFTEIVSSVGSQIQSSLNSKYAYLKIVLKLVPDRLRQNFK